MATVTIPASSIPTPTVKTTVKPGKTAPVNPFPAAIVPDTSSSLNTVLIVGGVALAAVLLFAFWKSRK
jgi:LPXTG-motif cell wall-anchored protein